MTRALSHGRAPRGRGGWAFCPESFADTNEALILTVWTPSMTYAEAVKWLRVKVAELRSTAPLGSPYLETVWAVMP